MINCNPVDFFHFGHLSLILLPILLFTCWECNSARYSLESIVWRWVIFIIDLSKLVEINRLNAAWSWLGFNFLTASSEMPSSHGNSGIFLSKREKKCGLWGIGNFPQKLLQKVSNNWRHFLVFQTNEYMECWRYLLLFETFWSNLCGKFPTPQSPHFFSFW